MTIQEALALGRARLSETSGQTAPLDASLLLGAAMGLDRAQVLARWRPSLSKAEEHRYLELLDRRTAGISTSVLTGHREFWGLDFLVSEQVLVPRPETELLVEKALEYIDNRLKTPSRAGTEGAESQTPLRILDLCTGSLCIAASLKNERPSLEVHAADLSSRALALARENARRILGNVEAISFHEGDLFEALPPELRRESFDLVVSNPPYVRSEIIPTLALEVQNEPLIALDGGSDGLDIIRRLIPAAFSALKPSGRLLLEAGGEQRAAIAGLLAESGFLNITVHEDLAGVPRASLADKP